MFLFSRILLHLRVKVHLFVLVSEALSSLEGKGTPYFVSKAHCSREELSVPRPRTKNCVFLESCYDRGVPLFF